MIEVPFIKLDEEAIAPRQAYAGDAGWDLFCLERTEVPVGVPTDIRTGLAVAIPEGYYGRIVHRSSAPRRRGVMVLEGIIDSGFRGELFACAYAWLILRPQDEPFRPPPIVIAQGESIAQLIVQPVEPIYFVGQPLLPASERGLKGFGSSGN
jgi:dUTP pyrophosphatase